MKAGDKRKFNGGHKNSGRKSKAEEQQLIEKLGVFEDEAMAALKKAVINGDGWAIKLFMEYKYGKAVARVEGSVDMDILWSEVKQYD